MPAPYVVKIATTTVSGSSSPSMVFDNIPQTYAHLWVIGSLRSTRSAGASSLGCYMNTDTSVGNYDYARYYYYSALASNPARDSGSSYLCGYMPGASTESGTFGSVETFLANYTVSGRHYYGTKSGFGDTTSSYMRYAIVGNQYAISTTISKITYVDIDGGNFAVGSTLTLYGIKDS